MTTIFLKSRPSLVSIFLIMLSGFILFNSCKKEGHHHNNEAAKHSADVIDKWMTLQLRLIKNATGIPNQAFTRHYAYAGIAAMESIAPGIQGHSKWTSKWNGLTGLPVPDKSVTYYYPANVNAALAAINRSIFPNASAVDKLAIDSLEAALNAGFLATESASTITQSNNFGKAVATAVYNWSETDGYKVAGNPYTPPVKEGYWVPTPPAFAPPASPYWGNNRTIIAGSLKNIQVPAPIPYSTDPQSPFYQMVKEVYDVSLHLTEDQKAMAFFWRDVPGATSPGHWLSILQQVIRKTHSRLDKAAIAYALSGAAANDAIISCWKTKYQYSLVRPITYIRNVMGHTTWNSFITTPAHPEYSSGHSALSSGAAGAMTEIFGNVGSITDHTYDYMGFAPRTYTSLMAIAEEAAVSRLYGGIHYKKSLDVGLMEGKQVVANIFSKPYQSGKD